MRSTDILNNEKYSKILYNRQFPSKTAHTRTRIYLTNKLFKILFLITYCSIQRKPSINNPSPFIILVHVSVSLHHGKFVRVALYFVTNSTLTAALTLTFSLTSKTGRLRAVPIFPLVRDVFRRLDEIKIDCSQSKN